VRRPSARVLLTPLILLALLAAVLLLLPRNRDRDRAVSAPREAVLRRQVQGLETLLAAARQGELVRFEQVLVTLDEKLIRELLESAMPFERIVDDKYRIRVEGAQVHFHDGFALVELEGRASLAGRDEKTAFAQIRVYGGLDVVGLDPESGVLRARVNVIGFEVPQVGVLGLTAPVRRIVERLADEPVQEFNVLASNLEVPVAVEPRVAIPAIEGEEVRIASAVIPLRVAVEDVKVAAGKLWVAIGVELKAEGAAPQVDSLRAPGAPEERSARASPGGLPRLTASTLLLSTARAEPLSPALDGGGPPDTTPSASDGLPDTTHASADSFPDTTRTSAEGSSDTTPTPAEASQERTSGTIATPVSEEDPAAPVAGDTPGMAALRRRYAVLRDSVDALAHGDTLVTTIAADTGDVAVGIRPELVNLLLQRASASYLDRVDLRLQLEEEVEESEEVKVKALFAKVKAGRWRVNVTIHRVEGVLAARDPTIGVAGENRLRVTVPVRLESGHGNATIRFAWDASGVASAACRDFTKQLDVEGNVVPREYRVVGDFVLESEGQSIVARPQFEQQKVRISVAPSPETWAQLRSTLASLDDFGKCGIGMEFISADKIIRILNGVVTKGFNVKLPTKLIPTLELPAGVSEEVEVGDRRLRVIAAPNVLRVTPQAFWYSARVDAGVQTLQMGRQN
jgi:hypothetical protein